MQKSSFNVIDYMTRRGAAWQEGLSDNEREGLLARLESLELGVRPGGARAVADILTGRFHDDGAMQRILLETMGRFGSFTEVMEDVRLRDGNTVLGQAVVDNARDHYNTALAVRLGLHAQEGELAGGTAVLDQQQRQWLEALPDYQAEELAAVHQQRAYPKDVVLLLAHSFEHPKLLNDLVKQSVQEMRPFGGFLRELRQWGELSHLDPSMAARVRRCYHVLTAQSLGLDVPAELDRRTQLRADMVEAEDVLAPLAEKYEHPEVLPAALDEAVRTRMPFKEVLQALRRHGDLAHLTTAEAGKLQRDYRALTVRHAHGKEPAAETTREALEEGQTATPGPWSQAARAGTLGKGGGVGATRNS